MKRFGIIGDPVSHSMSPRLFTAAYHGRYPYDLIEGACFETSWERFLQDYDGINVTAPFKELAFRAVDRLSPEAQRIGAANLVVKTPEGTVGYNSDYDGVRLAIQEALSGQNASGQSISGPGKALIIGCGGAGKAAAAAALDLGYELILTNRNTARAEQLARLLASSHGSQTIAVIPLAGLREAILSADLILYTVPGPLDGCPPADIVALLAATGRPCTLLEANYRDPVFSLNAPGASHPLPGMHDTAPATLPEIHAVPEMHNTAPSTQPEMHAIPAILPANCAYISGRRWLFHQAAAGYIRFTGEAPDLTALSAALPIR